MSNQQQFNPNTMLVPQSATLLLNIKEHVIGDVTQENIKGSDTLDFLSVCREVPQTPHRSSLILARLSVPTFILPTLEICQPQQHGVTIRLNLNCLCSYTNLTV